MIGKMSVIAIALVAAGIGAHSIKPRELFLEMYPVEPVKQDAFQICDDSDPTFVRAVGYEREACYNKMPHVMAVAMGRVRPGGALSLQALSDSSREAELLMLLASTPPRQPITVPRSYSDTAWMHALASTCDAKRPLAVADTAPSVRPPLLGGGRAVALDNAIRGNLPPLPDAAWTGVPQPGTRPVIQFGPARDPGGASLPIVTLVPDSNDATGSRIVSLAPEARVGGKTVALTESMPAPDIGDTDAAPPAIVPLARASGCGGV
jgi:hypothetical protein